MFSETVIKVKDLGKCYQIFPNPQERLKQSLLPKLQNLISPLVRLFNPGWQIQQKYFQDFWAIQGASFELKRGETVGIIGRNGSGKSTLLQLICGTLTPTIGKAEVFGRIAALLELGAGFNPEFTGRENVYLNASLYGLSKKDIDDRYDKILDFADIGHFINQPVKTYSSGMFVRLAFAVIANVDADVLIVDEALAVGDTFFQQKCIRFLKNFKEKGTILFVSHDTQTVSSMCDYAVWLDAGQVKAIGDAKQICEQYYGMQYQENAALQQDKKIEKTAAEKSSYNAHDAFGTGDASILDVQLLGTNNTPLTWIQGGEEIKLVIRVKCNREIESPIIGFLVKDRLGQHIFGDNTFTTNPISRIHADTILEAQFHFILPLLKSGNYSIAAAVATGTIESHAQLHWVHDALVFTIHSRFQYEILMSIPMRSVSVNLVAS